MAMFESATTALHGWHPGEISIQDLLGHKSHVQFGYSAVRDHLPDQHRTFHTSNIAFLPLTTLDSDGRPWVSLVASNKGTVGFVSSPSEVELVIEADIWKGDPIASNLQFGDKSKGKALIAGLGIEWATRRRNKFAGLVKYAALENGRLELELDITQTLGNCPKYINVRSVGSAATSPQLVFERPNLEKDERLPNDVIELIHKADTIFIGSTYVAEPSQQEMYPSHVGTNQRGGRSGFVRVRNDGLTLVLPDYSGNRFMNSLGNIQATPLAALSILDFETGDVLYVTGRARNVIGDEAQSIMARTNVVTLITATGYSYVRNAMPVRQLPGSKVYPSPYSPPVRYLTEEKPVTSSTVDTKLTLERIQLHSSDLATFYFSPSSSVTIRPGQAAIIDMNSFVGARGYQHMAQNGDESSLNDDGIRTWTVSGQTEAGTLMITMREKPGGFVTSRLFSMVRKMGQVMPGLLEDARPVGLVVQLMGVDGEFVLPKVVDGESPGRLLWVAGGVGITPFLSMLRGALREGGKWDIVLAIAARRGDVEVLGRLVAEILGSKPSPGAIPLSLALQITIYSTGFSEAITPDFGTLPDGSPVGVHIKSKRLSQGDLASSELDITGRNVYVCGPLAMEELVLQGVKEAGIDPKSVHRENFAY